MAQVVEPILGKDEVTSWNLVSSSKSSLKQVCFRELLFVRRIRGEECDCLVLN